MEKGGKRERGKNDEEMTQDDGWCLFACLVLRFCFLEEDLGEDLEVD